jgi:hypothetical protein
MDYRETGGAGAGQTYGMIAWLVLIVNKSVGLLPAYSNREPSIRMGVEEVKRLQGVGRIETDS